MNTSGGSTSRFGKKRKNSSPIKLINLNLSSEKKPSSPSYKPMLPLNLKSTCTKLNFTLNEENKNNEEQKEWNELMNGVAINDR